MRRWRVPGAAGGVRQGRNWPTAHRGLEPSRTLRLSAGAREGPRGPLTSSDVARKISTLVEGVLGGLLGDLVWSRKQPRRRAYQPPRLDLDQRGCQAEAS